jgi:hypothetical protein
MPLRISLPIDLKSKIFDARPDTVDFRDKIFVPTLIEVPTMIPLEDYLQWAVPVLNQGQEGACTGFGLATVANYLLRKRRVMPDTTPVSPRMIYEMAKRYDIYPGEKYQGSSARAAMKGWHKHGICEDEKWPYQVGEVDRTLTQDRVKDASKRPLGAYFRVNHKDLVAMHSALSEVEILYATAKVHDGWGKPDDDGKVPYQKEFKDWGGHAFAIVAYDEHGFWIQNSWGEIWGRGGVAHLSYDDWLENGTDVWVARLGVPIRLQTAEGAAATRAPGAKPSQAYSYTDLRPHIISIDNNGKLDSSGTYSCSQDDLKDILLDGFPERTKGWDKKRLLLYTPGGLVSESVFVQRIAEYRSIMLELEIYPLAFLWHTDFWNTVTTILQGALHKRRPDGNLDDSLDFMLDRLDDTLEAVIHRSQVGESAWDQIKHHARSGTIDYDGGVRKTLEFVVDLVKNDPDVEIHILGHSMGSILLAQLVKLLTTKGPIQAGTMRGTQGYGINIASCTLWTPANTITEFNQTFLPATIERNIQRLSVYTLTDEAELGDHCANIYHKSLLYLISNSLERKRETPLIGMEKYISSDDELMELFRSSTEEPPYMDWMLSPNDAPEGTYWSAKARHHGDIDDDPATLQSTLMRILHTNEKIPELTFKRSSSSLKNKRSEIM